MPKGIGGGAAPAKVISLSVRPLQVSHLCFSVDGILGDAILSSSGEPVASLGAPVSAFPFDAFYSTLASAPPAPAPPDKSRLLYDWLALQSYTKPYALATLRAEGRKLALQKAINARQNAFYAKYGSNQAGIIQQMLESYSPLKDAQNKPVYPDSKPNRLANLSTLATNQWNSLNGKYEDPSNNRTGAFKSGVSHLGSTGKANDLSVQFYVDVPPSPPLPAPPAKGESWGNLLFPPGGHMDPLFIQEAGTSSGTAATTNDDYGYRVPYIEAQAQNERAQISLIDQQFAQFMAGQTLPNLLQVFTNELNSIDMDVARLQVAVLDTILMSPIAGKVTGVYKNPGDFVRAGEPIIRVEDTSTVLLVARLLFPQPISIGETLTINTTLFEFIPNASIAGPVVAVRGRSEDDQWEVIVQYTNDGTLPLGYHFDYDDTTATIG
jgi:hypothetical protein